MYVNNRLPNYQNLPKLPTNSLASRPAKPSPSKTSHSQVKKA